MNQPRIIMVIPCFRPLVGGGEGQAERLARALSLKGHEVTVLTRLLSKEWAAEEMLDDFRIVRVAGLTRYGFTLRMIAWISRHHREIDVLHAHQSSSSLVAASIGGAIWGLPVVCTPMNCLPELDWTSGGGISRIKRVLFRRVNLWAAKSDEIACTLAGFVQSGNRVRKIPNGVDTGVFCPTDGAKGDAQIPTAIFAGRIEQAKRIDVVLQAWKRVKVPGRLLIVGEGSLLPQIKRLSATLQLKEVEFLGHCENVAEVLGKSHIFVLASEREGMPNALLEAMSCGLTCVASSVGAIPEMLGNGAGLLVPPGDTQALAIALETVFQDEGLRMRLGARARSVVEERYSMNSIVERYERVYSQLACRN